MESRSVCQRVALVLGLLVGFSCAALAAEKPGKPEIQLAQARPPAPRPARDPAGDHPEDEGAFDGVFLPPDRGAKRRLEMAQQMVDDQRYGEAVRLLGSLLESNEDYFFKPNPEAPLYRSLKAEAGRLISTMPKEGRDSYELQFGARARQMLKAAAAPGSQGELAEVSRRFFSTEAGQDATFLLGRNHLDQNRPLAAAMCFERLLEGQNADRLEPVLSLSLALCWQRTGDIEKAKEALARVKSKSRGGELIVAGKPVKLFGNISESLDWLAKEFGSQRAVHQAEAEQWVLFRGDESRNAPSVGGPPLLNVRWRQRTADDRTVEKFVNKLRSEYVNQEIAALPSLHPLAVGDVIVMRTAFALQAVDFQSGKLVWRYGATDDAFEQFLKAGSYSQSGQSAQLLGGLDQRVWDDATYGTLSSDGAQIYYVDDLGLSGVGGSQLHTVLPDGRQRASTARIGNRLAARELRTQGKLKWEVGGANGGDEPKLAGAYFLGPPLPLLGHLYVLAETKGQEIRLMALSPQTGALEWSQQLAVVDPGIQGDQFRRNAGAVPSFADGVLVCPTSAGAIVAIDLTTRSLLWGYQYPRQLQGGEQRLNLRVSLNLGTERRGNERWADASVTIAGGRVLITPVESDQIYCLNLLDGKEMWKQDRDHQLYVACVHRGNVVLVGRHGVSALSLSDGETAWPEIELPSGSMPSGRGFYSGDDYYLPLTSAEVAKINLRTGRIESRARSRAGSIPGNLVCYRGSIISQGVDYLDVYYQLDALKQQIAKSLEAQPDDAKALASLAEIKLDEGALGEAIALFRRSNQLKSEPATREQLVESLLEGLRIDFASYRGSLDELDQLIEHRAHRLKYLRLKGLGLQTAGEWVPAFETYLQLADQDANRELDAVDEELSVGRNRWLRTRFEELRAAASGPQKDQIDAAVTTRLSAALADPTSEPLRAFLDIFGAHPAANQAREALVTRLKGGDLLEREMLLRRLAQAPADAEVAPAVGRLADLMREANRAELAAVYYRQLAGKLADVQVRDGKTGRQLVDELPADSPIRTILADNQGWPLGNVTVQEKEVARIGGGGRPQRPIDLEIVGPSAPFFENLNISLDQQQNLLAQDGLGERRFRVPLMETQGRQRFSSFNRYNGYNQPALYYVSVNGNLMLLSLGNQLMAIDTLRGSDTTSNRILWTQEMNEPFVGLGGNQLVRASNIAVAWGASRVVTEDAFGRRIGTIGPVHDDSVYFQRMRDVCCVDPLTGKMIWQRKNVAPGNDLFGDKELLFIAPPGDAETLVLRAATGEKLGVRRIAPFEKRMATFGRRVLSWEAGSPQVLEMRDAWENEVLWSYTFTPGSKAAMVSQEVLGVMQPDGEFTLIALPDGKQLAKEKLEPEGSLLGIHLLKSRGQYLLVTNSAVRQDSGLVVSAIPAVVNNPIINGRVYAFDSATGKSIWPAPAVVSQHAMLLSQPSQLPVLAFVRQVHRRAPPSAQEPKTSAMFIDKRTGRVVYENDQLPIAMTGTYELSGDRAAKTVTFGLPGKAVTLTFTEDPAGAEAVDPTIGARDDQPLPTARNLAAVGLGGPGD